MPGDPKASDTRIYELGSSSQVTLTITIGDDQLGAPQAMYGGETIPMEPDVPKTMTVKKNTVLNTVTMVRDVSPDTNVTEVTYDMSGGVRPDSATYSMTVTENGHVVYLIDYLFT